jgi:glycosyltransferase involved in cell wall biosynthesis
VNIKPLFIAFACEPERGSEPGVGWHTVFHASRKRPVWVITDSLHRNKIEAYLAKHDEQSINVVYHALPKWCQWMWKSSLSLNLYYYLWHRGAAKIARQLHEEHRFDVVHHVSYVRYWMPSAGSRLGIPFVWGPVGGGESAPPGFLSGCGLKGRLEETVRSMMRWVFERDPCLKSCANSANIAIACSTETAERMKRLGVKQLLTMSCIGTNAEQTAATSTSSDGKLRFISVGRLLHWKGFHFGLQAFAKANLPNAEFVIVGGGPELPRLKRLAEDLGIAQRVTFTGELPWREGLEQFKRADVLVHPSLHDSGGFVLLEAMELSKPVICLDLGGPGVHVDSRNGFAVPAISIGQVIADLAKAMAVLSGDPELRRTLGEAGRERVLKEFTWESKASRYEDLYRQIVRSEPSQQAMKSAG